MASRTGHIGWRQVRTIGEAPPQPAPSVAVAQPEEAPAGDSIVPKLVMALVALYAFVFCTLSVQQHASFQTNAFDLGNMDQAVWNTAEGRPFEFTNWEGGTSRLAAHVEPILLLVAQVYRLRPDATTLLILQSVVISLGALPAFWLARRVLRSDFAAAVFAGSYLLSPALEVANLADFHAVALSSALLLYAFWFVYRRQYLWFGLFAVLAMATKEQVPASVFLMGVYISVIQRQRAVGAVTCVVAVLWAAIALGWVIPAHNVQGVSPYLARYDQLGKTPAEMAAKVAADPSATAALLMEPAKADYVLNILSPTLFLGLLSPFTLVMTVPDFAINLFSNFSESFAGRAHYGAVIVPFVTVSAILGVGLVRRVLALASPAAAQWSVALLSVAVLGNSLLAFRHQVFLPLADHLPVVDAHDRAAEAVLKLIPAEAAVAASSTLNPHVSQRRQLSLFPDIDKADYIVLDVTSSPYPIDTASQWYRVTQLLQGGDWGVAAGRDGVLLLRRGEASTEIPNEFYSFVAGDGCAGGRDLDQAFGQAVRLVKYRLEPTGKVHGADPYVKLHLCWQVAGQPGQDFATAVSVVDETGKTISTDRFQPSLLWRPSATWQAGDHVETVASWLPLGVADKVELRVRLLDRQAPYGPLDELRPTPSGRGGLGLRDDGSLALATVERER